jgi:hypothetical protein
MIEFSIVPIEDAARAHSWHQRLANENDHIYLRSDREYEIFAKTGQLWGAWSGVKSQYAGQAYCRQEDNHWEIGGLLVDTPYRELGVGTTLVYLAFGHLLCTEDPLSFGYSVVTRVQIGNHDVDRLINRLHLKKTGPVTRPGKRGDTLKGDQYQLVSPVTLSALATWCDRWDGKLKKDTPAQIQVAPYTTLVDWAAALRRLAKSWKGIKAHHGCE